ncbi:type II secretion system F family protein [Sporolactobacillus sp. CPB3-1]|uniref:Type II secretion system F family protein n=1 Tax=Sporolactobacillus mangiferae TaxID=2940498 RepID=A0ABT0MCF9_9BACL|nr:competence type IV pilus assembly protein ComGB [Sporolactobacillus mangiferae]MCL1632546.1 type II secretion system F family protein [Sporolactobacillus mangiferae]
MFERKNWTRREQAHFLINLGECMKSGYPLKSALQIQADRNRSRIRNEILQMIECLKGGKPFYETLLISRFPEDISCVIYFSEASGKLSDALIENGHSLMKREIYRQTLTRLIRYPLFLIWFLFMIIYVVGRFLLPNFVQMYRSMALELPAITRWMLFFAEHTVYMLGILVVLFAAVLLVAFFIRRFSLLSKIAFIARVPWIQSFIQLHYTYQFSFHVSSLLRSGLSMGQVIDIFTKKGASAFLELESTRINRLLAQGISLEKTLENIAYYLPELQTVIVQGSVQGSLGDGLHNYSNELMKRMEQKIKGLLAMCQPALLMFIGGFVLLLFLSILLPVFQMINGF